ncbi:radical SAM protein [bacterium]|nr:radical SAM protein [bacterium]
MTKTVRICHYKKLKIKLNGDVYPCCTSYPHTKLGNIFDENIYQKIENANIICECPMFKSVERTPEDKIDLDYIHYETSNICQASCVCCPQCKDKMQNEEQHLEKIREIIEHYKPKNIIAIGGEILVQEKAFNDLFELKKKYPEMKISTITNLCVGKERLKKAEEIFDKMTVSMLGFTELTYKNEMGLDFSKTMDNFNELYENKKVKLSPKYLAMPTNLFEIIPFFNWAINLDVKKIYLHCIHEFEQVANLKNPYWTKTFAKVEKQLKSILENNKELLISKNRHFISIHTILAEKTNINQQYIDDAGLTNIIRITV